MILKNIYQNQKTFHGTVFYRETRKKMNILMNGVDPVGGKWSFDEDNRKKLPKGTKIPSFPKINETFHTKTKRDNEKKFFKTSWFNKKFLVCY